MAIKKQLFALIIQRCTIMLPMLVLELLMHQELVYLESEMMLALE